MVGQFSGSTLFIGQTAFGKTSESGGAVLEELILPLVDLAGLQAMLIAKVRQRDLLDQVSLEDGQLLGAFQDVRIHAPISVS